MRALALLLLLSCGPPADGSLGALCRCSADDTRCMVQVSSCGTGLRCSLATSNPAIGGVCVPDDAGP